MMTDKESFCFASYDYDVNRSLFWKLETEKNNKLYRNALYLVYISKRQ